MNPRTEVSDLYVKLTTVGLYWLLSPNSLSVVIRVPSYLQMWGVYLSHERFVLCFLGDRGGSEFPSCICCFSSNFNSK